MKKLVYICNSLDRLKLLDKLNFKDDFHGEVYIVSDDRYMNTYRDIIDYINTCTNPTLKRSKFVSLKNEVIPYVISKMSIPGYEEDFSKLLLIATLITPVYFCRDKDDLTFIVEDDVVLFKNPESLMDKGLQCTATPLYPMTTCPNQTIRDIFNIFKGNVLQDKLGIDPNAESLQKELYDKYKKIMANANTVWTYIPELPEYFSKFMKISSTLKNIDINRRRGEKLYQYGFGVRLELFTACILLNHDVKFYDNNEIITQGREHFITGAKLIGQKLPLSYHYTVINDEYVFEYLPYLVENGYEEYKRKSKDFEYIKQNKFQYLDSELTNKFSLDHSKKKDKKKEPRVKPRRLF